MSKQRMDFTALIHQFFGLNHRYGQMMKNIILTGSNLSTRMINLLVIPFKDFYMYTITELQRIISESVKELIEREMHLFIVGANERSLTHKLACYITKRIPDRDHNGWDVDAEYNRIRSEMKSLDCIEFSQRTNYPDIIVHRRNLNNERETDDNNLMIIEVKVNRKFSRQSKDFKKIKCLIELNPYHYKFGIYINLNKGSNPEFTYFKRVFKDGKVVCEDVADPDSSQIVEA